MATAKWRNECVLRNRGYQLLAEFCYVDDARRLSRHREVLNALDPLHVKFLAVPAVKSGGADTLRMLRRSIWDDAKFLNDMIVYAEFLKNQHALVYLRTLRQNAARARATTSK
jgi:hypothetical protein